MSIPLREWWRELVKLFGLSSLIDDADFQTPVVHAAAKRRASDIMILGVDPVPGQLRQLATRATHGRALRR